MRQLFHSDGRVQLFLSRIISSAWNDQKNKWKSIKLFTKPFHYGINNYKKWKTELRIVINCEFSCVPDDFNLIAAGCSVAEHGQSWLTVCDNYDLFAVIQWNDHPSVVQLGAELSGRLPGRLRNCVDSGSDSVPGENK